MKLCEMRPGDRGRVETLTLTGPIRRRLLDLGFLPGSAVECLFEGCFGGIRAYEIGGAVIALRLCDGAGIHIETTGEPS